MTCATCGNQVPADDNFCDRCGTAVSGSGDAIFLQAGPAADSAHGAGERLRAQVQPAPQEIPQWSADASSAGQSARGVDASRRAPFVLAMDERVLKTYDAVQLQTGLSRRRRGQGVLFVTDARVVFTAWVYPRGTQRESWLFQQTKLEDISGVSAHVSRRINPLLLLLSAWFCTLTVICLIAATQASVFFAGFFIFGLIAAGCIAWLISSSKRRGEVGVAIHSRENGLSPIGFGRDPRTRSLGRVGWVLLVIVFVIFPPLGIFLLIFLLIRPYTVWDVVGGDPAEDTDRLLAELGALILDLQTRGRMAYAHWGFAPPDGEAGGETDGYQR
jgi:hypothetical protein